MLERETFKAGEQIHAFFDCIINDQNRYLSEDYMFSEYCRKIGIDIWALPMIELLHSGGYIFEGKMIDMAFMGVHATIDPAHARKKSKRRVKMIAQKNSS